MEDVRLGLDPDGITMEMSAAELTVLMTREALRALAARLVEISEAPPEDAYTVHLRSEASRVNESGDWIVPPLKYAQGVGGILHQIHQQAVEADIADRKLSADWSASPFELTFIHVTSEDVRLSAQPPDD